MRKPKKKNNQTANLEGKVAVEVVKLSRLLMGVHAVAQSQLLAPSTVLASHVVANVRVIQSRVLEGLQLCTCKMLKEKIKVSVTKKTFMDNKNSQIIYITIYNIDNDLSNTRVECMGHRQKSMTLTARRPRLSSESVPEAISSAMGV